MTAASRSGDPKLFGKEVLIKVCQWSSVWYSFVCIDEEAMNNMCVYLLPNNLLGWMKDAKAKRKMRRGVSCHKKANINPTNVSFKILCPFSIH